MGNCGCKGGAALVNEETLAAEAANGSQDALEVLLKHYRSYIYAIAYHVALNEEDALDITQNVMIRVVDKIRSFARKGKFKSWLATITTHESVNHLRRSGRREIPTDPVSLDQIKEANHDHDGAHPLDGLESEERRHRVVHAMERLSPQQRGIFALILFEGMRPKEIAEQMDIPAKQVSWQIHRGLEKIRQILADMETEPNANRGKRSEK